MQQFIGAGDGYAQDLCDRLRIEKQRQVIVAFVDGCFQGYLGFLLGGWILFLPISFVFLLDSTAILD